MKVPAIHAGPGCEVPEEDRPFAGTVVSVLITKGIGVQLESSQKSVPRGPLHRSAQHSFEELDHLRSHGIDHLLVEARIAKVSGQTIFYQDDSVVQCRGLIVAPARPIVGDDFEVFTQETGLCPLQLLPFELKSELGYAARVQFLDQTRIEL